MNALVLNLVIVPLFGFVTASQINRFYKKFFSFIYNDKQSLFSEVLEMDGFHSDEEYYS